jgi:hypothetical protein
MSPAKRGTNMTDREAVLVYRIKRAQKLLDVFEEINGRPAQTVQELEIWVASPAGKAALSENEGQGGTIIP